MESFIFAGSFKLREVLPGLENISPRLSWIGYFNESPGFWATGFDESLGLVCAIADDLLHSISESVSKAASMVNEGFGIERNKTTKSLTEKLVRYKSGQ